jgi:bifunctional DNA-binding transcriptional regulator/antitoxin component of YhaV-PrlF toxin-antitoxin module
LVKLQKRFAYSYESREGEIKHYKYQVTVPEQLVQKLAWKDGTELDQQIVEGKLMISRTSSKNKDEKKREVS